MHSHTNSIAVVCVWLCLTYSPYYMVSYGPALVLAFVDCIAALQKQYR